MTNEKAELSTEKLAATFLGSREFSDKILPPLLYRYPLPHFRVSGLPTRQLLEWARSALPLSKPTSQALDKARTWRQVLTALLADPAIRRMLPPGVFASLSASDPARFAADTEAHEILGAIDDFSTFEIKGWALDLLNPDQPLSLEIFLDNFFIGNVRADFFRRDVQEKVGGDGKAGFLFNIPAAHQIVLESERLLTIREALSGAPIAMPICVRAGRTGTFDALLHLRHDIEVISASLERIKAAVPGLAANSDYPLPMYDAYQKMSRIALMVNRQNQIAEGAALQDAPAFAVILFGDGEVSGAVHSINSLRRQSYGNWECIISIPFSDPEARSTFGGLSSGDNRIKAIERPAGMVACKAINEAAQLVKADFLVWLKEGDLLSEDALFELALVLKQREDVLVYFDEDRFERQAGRTRYLFPVLKTDFDHDHLLATNYIGNAFACGKATFDELGGFRSEFEPAHEYDLLLRMIEKLGVESVVHLQKILYHRQAADPQVSKEDSSARLHCVNTHLKRSGIDAVAEAHLDPFGTPLPNCQRIVWPLRHPAPVVSIIIPTRDRADLLKPCIESVLRSQEMYPTKFELLVMDNDSVEPETLAFFERVSCHDGVRVIPFPGVFNWSAINNRAARLAGGEILIFLNNDTRVLSPDWTRELAAIAMRPDVGAVGARLLYQDGTIQHGGVVLGGRAVHEAAGQRPGDGGYLGRAGIQRNVSAVTGACLATRKRLFFELGGFDELNLKVAFNDIDYCLKVRRAGLSVIYTPFATLYHFESKSRGLDDDYFKRLRSQNEIRFMRSRWGQAMEQDPFYNIRFNRTGPPFTRLRPPQVIGAPQSHDDDQELWDAE